MKDVHTFITFLPDTFTARTAGISVFVIVAQPFWVLHYFVTSSSIIKRSLVISRPAVICSDKDLCTNWSFLIAYLAYSVTQLWKRFFRGAASCFTSGAPSLRLCKIMNQQNWLIFVKVFLQRYQVSPVYVRKCLIIVRFTKKSWRSFALDTITKHTPLKSKDLTLNIVLIKQYCLVLKTMIRKHH